MPQPQRDLLLSSSIGTIVEWYDFFVFASAAVLVFDRAFFPRADPLNGVLFSLMTYAVGFVTRPVGGVLFGVLGDRYGRKRALVWSLMLMGVATVAVGVVPGYATIGVAAPILLVVLRLTQGLAVGGEVGGALLLVAESLPASRRGYWTAWPMIGGAMGNLLSAGVLALLGILLGDRAFVAWGWRLAFIASGLLVFVGVWIRSRIEESPLFLEYISRRAGTARPRIAPTLAAHWRSVLTVLLVKAGENALFYVFTTFFVVYVTRVLHRPRELALSGAAVASVLEVATIFAAGAWSDRIGRRPVTAIGLVSAAVWSFVLFPVAASGGTATVMLAAGIGGVCHGVIVGGMSAFFVELFPTSARYTGFSLGYQLASVFGGAVAPIVGVALLTVYGSTLPVSLYAAACHPCMRPSLLLVATILLASACSADSNSSPISTPPGSTSSNGLNIAVDSGFADRTAVVATTIPASVHITFAGQPSAGVTVTWIVTAGHGAVSTASSTTDATGAATTTWTLGDTAGVNTLEATITGASATMQVTGTAAAAAALIAASPDSDAVVAGASTLITIRAADRFGNAVAGVVASWTATGGALTVTSTTTAANGRAEVVFTSDGGPRAYVVTATAPGLAPVNFKILGL